MGKIGKDQPELDRKPGEEMFMKMKQLEPPDSHFLMAAIGWLELGVPEEAKQEMRQISQEKEGHPDVLEVWWRIAAEAKEWDGALEVARRLLSLAPERADGWLHQAYALRRASEGGLEKAWEALKAAAEKFRKEPIIPYNLACYACQLGELEEARVWLKRALKVGGKKGIIQMALEDPDLETMWEEIRKM
jgi:predicted Zn-dependent protease